MTSRSRIQENYLPHIISNESFDTGLTAVRYSEYRTICGSFFCVRGLWQTGQPKSQPMSKNQSNAATIPKHIPLLRRSRIPELHFGIRFERVEWQRYTVAERGSLFCGQLGIRYRSDHNRLQSGRRFDCRLCATTHTRARRSCH